MLLSTVNVVLAYVHSGGDIPEHLLSRPLLQRHHFLALSPANPTEYLAWPSADQSHAVDLLLSAPIPDLPCPVQYLPDSEYIQAHVRITSDLRLVFLYDNEHGWLYHNAALMPFPPNSYPSFDDALAASSPDDFLPEQTRSFTFPNDDQEDDSYWGAYGQDDLDEPPSSSAKPISEDAYWAQYSTVQGSGDSTLPSPRSANKKLPEPERIIVASDDLQTNHTELYNPLEPPAPASLARRLAALSQSGDNSPPLFHYPSTDSSTSALLDAVPALTSSSSTASPAQSDRSLNPLYDPAQDILRDNLKSLYQLWKLTKSQDSDNDKENFLAVVRQALQHI